MPFDFKEYDKGLHIRYFDFVAPSDFLASRDVVAGNPNHARYEFALCDFSNLNAECIWALTPEIVDSVGRRNVESPRDQSALRKLAFVSSSEKIRSLLRLYIEKQMTAPNAEARLFRTVAQAWSWIEEDMSPEGMQGAAPGPAFLVGGA